MFAKYRGFWGKGRGIQLAALIGQESHTKPPSTPIMCPVPMCVMDTSPVPRCIRWDGCGYPSGAGEENNVIVMG